jgi:hypothetical protein
VLYHRRTGNGDFIAIRRGEITSERDERGYDCVGPDEVAALLTALTSEFPGASGPGTWWRPATTAWNQRRSTWPRCLTIPRSDKALAVGLRRASWSELRNLSSV